MGFRARHVEPFAGQIVADGRDVRDGAEFILDEGVADGEGNVEAVDGYSGSSSKTLAVLILLSGPKFAR